MAAATIKPLGPPMQQPPQKTRPNPAPREGGSNGKKPGRLPPMIRVAISVWIVWHFTGVFLAALSIGVTSPLVIQVAQNPPMQWYLDALYLNQGHSFFAPEVGPGHIIRYQLYDQSGRVADQGEFPNSKEYWPRLRNHRYMMLADQADFGTDDKAVRDFWQRKYLEAFARQLLRENPSAQAARLHRVAHWPLPREYAAQGRELTDPESYDVLIEATQRRSDLPPEENAQSLNWQNGGVQSAGRWTGGPR